MSRIFYGQEEVAKVCREAAEKSNLCWLVDVINEFVFAIRLRGGYR